MVLLCGSLCEQVSLLLIFYVKSCVESLYYYLHDSTNVLKGLEDVVIKDDMLIKL